jgi:predicted RNA-binding protein YlxR (DUF448 family)
VPLRRCVGCGRIAPKSELIRIAAGDAGYGRTRRALCDPLATMPGRGAYLCRGGAAGRPAAECLAVAMRRGGIARALRCAVTVPPELVESIEA